MNPSISELDSIDFDDDDAYAYWRDGKLDDYPESPSGLVVELADLGKPTEIEMAAIRQRIGKTNMAFYASRPNQGRRESGVKEQLAALGLCFGLRRLDANLCADEDAISSLSVAEGGRRGRYIPYTSRPISWHTDGYYNKLDQQIRGMILHCLQPAAEGGENAVMDHEIAYILMRENNPDMISALKHPEAMQIPANDEGNGVIREAQTGPVFSFSDKDGSLHMRYTARTRSIIWRDDGATAAAVAFLSDLLQSDSRYIFKHRMNAGEGLVCNNVLHNRSGFEDTDDQHRLFFRARYLDRII